MYKLEVWDKTKRKYITTWKGHTFVQAQIMAAKPYNNYEWMGKKRIISIITKVEMIIPHVNQHR